MTAWAGLATVAPVQLTEEQYAALAAAYAKPPRAYHSFAHVIAVVQQWCDVDSRLGWQHRPETFLALLYHDAIYVAGRSDNENLSSRLACSELKSIPVDLGEVARLIELTSAHGKLAPEHVDGDAALFLDCDMAILGAAPETFAAYEAGIANEYAQVSANMYRLGRRRFLERLLAQSRIFLSEDFHRRLDGVARINLCSALAAL